MKTFKQYNNIISLSDRLYLIRLVGFVINKYDAQTYATPADGIYCLKTIRFYILVLPNSLDEGIGLTCDLIEY